MQVCFCSMNCRVLISSMLIFHRKAPFRPCRTPEGAADDESKPTQPRNEPGDGRESTSQYRQAHYSSSDRTQPAHDRRKYDGKQSYDRVSQRFSDWGTGTHWARKGVPRVARTCCSIFKMKILSLQQHQGFVAEPTIYSLNKAS